MIDLDAATVLLALGADPTVASKHNGPTPCMLAACNSDSVPCLRALAAGGPGGALGDAVNALFRGRTAPDFAVRFNKDEATACLRDEPGGKRAADL